MCFWSTLIISWYREHWTERSLRWSMIPARSFRDAYFSASAEQILTVMILLHRWQSREPEY